MHVVKKPTSNQGTMSSALTSAPASSYIVDILLHCASGVVQENKRPRPRPCPPGEKGEMHVVRASTWCHKFDRLGRSELLFGAFTGIQMSAVALDDN